MKKFLSILLSATMILSLTACGAKSDDNANDQQNTVNEDGTRDTYLTFRFLYNGIIIKHQKTEPTYTKTSLFLCEKRRFFMARREKGVVPIIYFEKERGKSF